MPGEWQIYVDGLEFYGYHGVPNEEQVVGHRYRLRLEIDFAGPLKPELDEIGQTIDYSEVGQMAVRFATENQFRTIEALAWGMGQQIMNRFKKAEAVSLTLEKALPPMPVIAEAAGITLRIER